jgi:hypothetical protein
MHLRTTLEEHVPRNIIYILHVLCLLIRLQTIYHCVTLPALSRPWTALQSQVQWRNNLSVILNTTVCQVKTAISLAPILSPMVLMFANLTQVLLRTESDSRWTLGVPDNTFQHSSVYLSALAPWNKVLLKRIIVTQLGFWYDFTMESKNKSCDNLIIIINDPGRNE